MLVNPLMQNQSLNRKEQSFGMVKLNNEPAIKNFLEPVIKGLQESPRPEVDGKIGLLRRVQEFAHNEIKRITTMHGPASDIEVRLVPTEGTSKISAYIQKLGVDLDDKFKKTTNAAIEFDFLTNGYKARIGNTLRAGHSDSFSEVVADAVLQTRSSRNVNHGTGRLNVAA